MLHRTALRGMVATGALLLAAESLAAPVKVPLPKPRPTASMPRAVPPGMVAAVPRPHTAPTKPAAPFLPAANVEISPADVGAVRQVFASAQAGRVTQADDTARGISDPVARKLAEWIVLRSD